MTWQTPAGRTVVSSASGHAWVVSGVVGEPGSPIGFWVVDPMYGEKYWTAGQLSTHIRYDPEQQGIAIN